MNGMPGGTMALKVQRMLRLGVVLAAACLSACGFRLAGTRPLPAPLAAVYIEVAVPYRVSEPPLEASLRDRLRHRGGEVATRPGAASAILRLTGLEESREVLSVGPDGKAIEFALTTAVTFTLLRDEQVLVPAQTLSATRDYSFRAEEILAKDSEERRLQEYIQDEMAELVLLRLEAALAKN